MNFYKSKINQNIYMTNFYVFILLLIDIFSFINCTIYLPFTTFIDKYNEKYNDNDTINNIYNKQLIVEILIGNPIQKSQFLLTFEKEYFILPFKSIYFVEELSNSYKEGKSKELDNGIYVVECADFFYFNEYKNNTSIINKQQNNDFIQYKDITFIRQAKSNKIKNEGILGLHIPTNNAQYNFINILKNANVIKNLIWTINYKTEEEYYEPEININFNGCIIIGSYPHEYNSLKFKKRNLKFIKAEPRNGFINWDLEFSQIYYEDLNNKNESYILVNNSTITLHGELHPEYHYMIAPYEFMLILEKLFFKGYVEKDICKRKSIHNDLNLFYYECINEKTKIHKFPDIMFEHSKFRTNFTLSYRDLFTKDPKDNNKLIFLLFFYLQTYAYEEDVTPKNWILGGIFMRKYQFVFNQDDKEIGLYVQNRRSNNRRNLTNGSSNFSKGFLIFLLYTGIVAIVGFILYKKIKAKLKAKRREKANELTDTFDYNSINDDVNTRNKSSLLYNK